MTPRAVFNAKLLDPYGEGLMSLADLVTQTQIIHPMWSAEIVLGWIDEHGHLDYLISQGHLPENCRPDLLDLVTEAIAANGADEAARCGQEGVHEWRRFRCTRRAGHPGEHRNDSKRVRWAGADEPVTDLDGRPLLKGTLPPPKPGRPIVRRRREW
ncbi:hypothetical protein AB0G05_19830 [Nonomuraea wenchangensis]